MWQTPKISPKSKNNGKSITYDTFLYDANMTLLLTNIYYVSTVLTLALLHGLKAL